MNQPSVSVWEKLRLEELKGSTLWARRAPFDSSDRLLAALDASNRRHWLIRIEPHEKDISDFKSRGLTVQTQELEGKGHPPGRYIDILCVDPIGHDAFDLIGKELASRSNSVNETPAECVSRVIAKWRRFWEHKPTNILSREAQIGLFAELWFLAWWLVPMRGLTSVASWRGPYRSRHDFEWDVRSVEVKATFSADAKIHTIHGLEQLVPPGNGDLLLFSLQLREEQGATNTLPSIVASCRDLFGRDFDHLDRLEGALSQMGYSDMHREEYEALKLRVAGERLYEVRDDFPRLTEAHFATGLPGGVSRIQYEINLSGFDHLCIARRPQDLASI